MLKIPLQNKHVTKGTGSECEKVGRLQVEKDKLGGRIQGRLRARAIGQSMTCNHKETLVHFSFFFSLKCSIHALQLMSMDINIHAYGGYL